jgi:hypothetical protein
MKIAEKKFTSINLEVFLSTSWNAALAAEQKQMLLIATYSFAF